jgi:hypothetical protein
MKERRTPGWRDHELPTNVRLDDVEMARLRRWFAQIRPEPMPCPFCRNTMTLDRTIRNHPSYAPRSGDTWALAVFSEATSTVALRCSDCGHLMEFDVEMIRRQQGDSTKG